jgi:hypothetical protein
MTVLYEVREMQDLSPRLQRWIKLFAATDGTLESAVEAMVEAGYKPSRSLAAKARKLLREHRTVINQQVRLRLQDTGRVMAAMAAVDEIVRDKAGSSAVRLNAAKDIMAKAGLEEVQRIQVDKPASDLTDQELLEKIEEFQDRLKLVPNESR